MIAIVDAGVGNLRSVERALVAAGADASEVCVCAEADVVFGADRVVVPGQGAFGDCARAFGASGAALAEAVREAIARGRPYLGICLGLQVLFERSDEAPGCAGLGVFAGDVQRLASDDPSVKIPHMGWNRAEVTPAGRASLGETDWYYFVHSYAVVPRDRTLVAAETEHGARFVSAVVRDNVLGVQFHPEKSQRAGLALLARWLRT